VGTNVYQANSVLTASMLMCNRHDLTLHAVLADRAAIIRPGATEGRTNSAHLC
jgi:hypothetical protein